MDMQNHADCLKLVDRDDEVARLLDAILNQTAQVNMLYSKSGTGKSSLVKKLMFKMAELNIPNVILVKTLPLNVCRASSEWLYIDFIFDAFSKYFETSSQYNFRRFLASGESDITNYLANEKRLSSLYNVSSFRQLFLNTTLSATAKVHNLSTYSPYDVSTDNSIRSRMIKAQYVGYIFRNHRIVFIMDNVQNIDGTSLKFFLDWLNETKCRNHYFLLQYTITETTGIDQLTALCDLLSDTGMQIEHTELSDMSANYVADIIDNQITSKPTSIRFNLEALQHYESVSDGNIRELLDFVRRYAKDGGQKIDYTASSGTIELINTLSSEAKCILSILVFSNGEMKKDVLTTIWNDYFGGENLSSLLQELTESKIVLGSTDSPKISVDHSSIIDEWDKHIQFFSGIDRLVYNRLEMMCVHILHCPDNSDNSKMSSYEAWQFLLRMYAKREPQKIQELLEQLDSRVISDVSVQNTWYYLNLLIECTKDEVEKYKAAYYKILSLCYKLGLFHEGMHCLEIMEQTFPLRDNHLLILYKINYLTGLDRFDEAINLYHYGLTVIDKTELAWVHLNLCILCSYRSINQISQCKVIGKQLKKQKKQCEHSAYAYYLRLTNIYLPNYAAIKYARRSVRYFEKQGDRYQAGKSLITYSKLLASVGKYRKALRVSKLAENQLAGRIEVSHFLYSNLAAYKLLQGERGTDIWYMLCQAELSATVSYSRLAIIVNKLAWCYENQDFEKLDLITNTAKKLIAVEPDEHIHALFYYNMFLISKVRGDIDQQNKYLRRATELQSKCRFIEARISGVGRHQREIRCRLKKPWHVCFLSFWTYDLPSDEKWIESS